jgi:HEAT repeats
MAVRMFFHHSTVVHDNGGVTEADPAEVVRHLLVAAGTPGYGAYLAEFERLGEAGCDHLFAMRASGERRSDLPRVPRPHPRDIAEDDWYAFVVAARRWPGRFLQYALSGPHRGIEIVILDALGEVDRPAAREMLVTAANDRRAGHALHREYAMRSLIKLGDPRVPDLLVRLVKDRDSSVRFASVKAAVELGDARLVPALRRLAQASRTPPGTRAEALDAIKAIIARENAGHV